ncbi:MAG TPA: lysylphosphatidylglycerol synthase domain-containing protein [Candidatus Binatia bacterium]|jgi:hypothetical protein
MTRRRRAARVVDATLVAAGFVLLLGLVWRVGGGTLLDHLRLVGAAILLIVGQEALAVVANTLGWRAAFPMGTAPPLPRLLAARIAGDAVNYVTPTASLGGELVRARLLDGRVPRLALATSIAVAKLGQTVGQAAFVAAGLALAVAAGQLAPALRTASLVSIAVLGTLVVALSMAQRRGLLAPLARLVTAAGPLARFAHLRGHAARLDAEIAKLHRAPDRPFLLSCVCFFVGWALGAVEIALMLWLLGVGVTATRAITIEALSVGLDAMVFFVPAKLGTQEGGKVLIFTALGLDPALGLAVGVLRRIRELVWALAGLVIVGRTGLGRDAAAEAARASSGPLTTD